MIRCILGVIGSITVLLFAILFQAARGECPPCLNNEPPLPGHGDAPDGSGRRIIIVQIKTGTSSGSWSDQPSGGTNPYIWNGLNGCPGCSQQGAIQMWNAKSTYYYFLNDQATPNSDIIIVRGGTSPGGCASSDWQGQPGTPPMEMNLPSATVGYSAVTIASRIAHELGHQIGLNDISVSVCSSIMNSSLPGCATNVTTTIKAADVTSSNQYSNDATRACCSSSNPYFPQGPRCSISCSPPGPPDCATSTPPNCTGTCHWDTTVCAYVDCGVSPILLDISGDGFNLTSAANGVNFNFSNPALPVYYHWGGLFT